MNSVLQAEVQEARELDNDLRCMWWDWDDDYPDDLPGIDATPLRVSFLEAVQFAPTQGGK